MEQVIIFVNNMYQIYQPKKNIFNFLVVDPNNIIMNEIIKMVDYEYRVIYYKSAVDLFKYFDTLSNSQNEYALIVYDDNKNFSNYTTYIEKLCIPYYIIVHENEISVNSPKLNFE